MNTLKISHARLETYRVVREKKLVIENKTIG